jgi:hypothetical protein
MRCHRSEDESTGKNKKTIIGCCEAWVEKRISPLRAHDENCGRFGRNDDGSSWAEEDRQRQKLRQRRPI